MIVIPAIDLKDEKVVRLLQGRYEKVTVYSDNPVETAKTWQRQGAGRLHVVDLDGAKAGEPKNIKALRRIIESVDVPVQFGGGLRRREDISAVLSMGAKCAILGTTACEDLNFVKQIIAEFGERIIVSIDVKDRKVAVRGWTETSKLEDIELIGRLQDIGAKSFIYTDISRDGTLAGSNIEGIKRALRQTGASIFYSGGISSMEDVKDLKALESEGLAGIIIGKALYENKINLTQVKTFLEKQ
ncbi:MAG: 1-(5-phosphoribosyl)-5-[(5-phosphoribosylamino)methylideneamino]imidazole-4-carboxamide isomerase [Candidatus Omnitrophica bacterium]|nr:1-(5-phosphoribosyl)-5-[(5-phosphoribosylamino)methylideneamino]imidazole-4-carboxamide isomerase [Candidatus Omnitrophota bacterium]MBU4140420.1 1-(5-phosphoribosyl)-5-[(5-phosphoribosylamino)methylideneamino]imidazole-4-carboxamide isomerase [Candidatus Omnitrophota bacterium]